MMNFLVYSGMWFDSKFGTMLKMDPYGNILVAMKGFKVLNSQVFLLLLFSLRVEFECQHSVVSSRQDLSCCIDYNNTNILK